MIEDDLQPAWRSVPEAQKCHKWANSLVKLPKLLQLKLQDACSKLNFYLSEPRSICRYIVPLLQLDSLKLPATPRGLRLNHGCCQDGTSPSTEGVKPIPASSTTSPELLVTHCNSMGASPFQSWLVSRDISAGSMPRPASVPIHHQQARQWEPEAPRPQGHKPTTKN